jgi:hypothetical protein
MRGAVHTQITTIGLDIAKNVFAVHGIDRGRKGRRSEATPARPGAGILQRTHQSKYGAFNYNMTNHQPVRIIQ